MSSHYGPPGRGGDDDVGDGRGQGGRYGPPAQRGPDPGRGGGGVAPVAQASFLQRGGGRGDGRGRGGRSGGGGFRGGRGESPDLSGQKKSYTNIVLATPQSNFDFFMYFINIQDRNGQLIDSKSRCRALFRMAILETLLLVQNVDPKTKKDLEKVLFFQGSILFSAKRIPGLEEHHDNNLPWKYQDEESGDTFEVQRVFHCLAPEVITPTNTTTSKKAPAAGKHEIELDAHRCSGCTKVFDDLLSLLQHCRSTRHMPVFDSRLEGATPALPGDFITYINLLLDKALGNHFAKWGRDYMDPSTAQPQTDRGRSLGVTVYQAFSCEFGFLRPKDPTKKAQIGLTVDLKAKVIRNQTVLDSIYGDGKNPESHRLNTRELDQARREWEDRTVIYTVDHKCYHVIRLRFDHSAKTLPVEGLGMTHAEYFETRKGITLSHPDARPMVEVAGKRQNAGNIFLPAELICGDELPPQVREKLPKICSFSPEIRNRAIDKVREALHPNEARGQGLLLPSCGISLREKRLVATTTIMSIPKLIAAGVPVPVGREKDWGPAIQRANFKVHANSAVPLKVVIFYNRNLDRDVVPTVYKKICGRVNHFNSKYQFASDQPYAMIPTAGPDNFQRHYEDVSNYLQQNATENLFVLDFCLPQKREDPAYPFIKQILSSAGHLSQFVSFRTFRHDRQPRDVRDGKKGDMIIEGVARQILQKCGVRLWWVKLPRELPLPAVFVGVDVFHAPKEYNPQTGRRGARPSCAAVIVQVARRDTEESHSVEIYSETFARAAGQEFELRGALESAIRNALHLLQVDPQSCIVWRDGIGEGAFGNLAREEIEGIRSGLDNSSQPAIAGGAAALAASSPSSVPMAYVVCQKKVKTKFFTMDLANHPDGKFASPPGTLVDGFQGLKNYTFYIQGRAPPFSTPKPVRYVVVEQDKQLEELNLPKLTWDLCHEYPNWMLGSIKVPGVAKMAHKLAELAGVMPNSGGIQGGENDGIDHRALVNKLHFL